MITKLQIENVLSKQRKQLSDRSVGITREIVGQMPYISTRGLFIGGVRGCGCSTVMLQLHRVDYPTAFYIDFSDPRLAGFDESDFVKLAALIAESGKGVLLLDKLDEASSWQKFLTECLDKGLKIVATVSLTTLKSLESGGVLAKDSIETRRVDTFSYNEYLELGHKRAGTASADEYIVKGGFAELIKGGHNDNVMNLYERIMFRDVIVANGVRDLSAIQRTAIHLITSSGQSVTANSLHKKLKIKAVSTVSEYLEHLERSGLVSFVPILSPSASRQAINPRKVYTVDPAIVVALSHNESVTRQQLFEIVVFNHLRRLYNTVCYTADEGGCDFVVFDQSGKALCVQVCYNGEDHDLMQQKIEGLYSAMEQTCNSRGVVVTLDSADIITCEGREIEIIDADAFLSEYF